MKDSEGHEHISTTEARQGATPRMTRVVLAVSMALIIVLFAIILLVAGR